MGSTAGFLILAIPWSDLLFRCKPLWPCAEEASEEGQNRQPHREERRQSCLHPSSLSTCIPCAENSNCQGDRSISECSALAHADPWPGISFSIPLLINSSFFKKQCRHPSSRKSSMTTQEAKLHVCLPQHSGISSALNSFYYVEIICSAVCHSARLRAPWGQRQHLWIPSLHPRLAQSLHLVNVRWTRLTVNLLPSARPPRPCGLRKEGLSWPSSSVIWPCLPQTRFSKTLWCFIAQMASPTPLRSHLPRGFVHFLSLHRSLRWSKFNPSSLWFSNLNIETEACGGSQNPASPKPTGCQFAPPKIPPPCPPPPPSQPH